MTFNIRSGGSFTKVGALGIIVVILLAVPVAAAISVQNFLTADVQVADACFDKTAGSDVSSGTGFLTFDATTTVSDGGVNLVQESLTIRAFAGDRLLYTDAMRYNNNCGSPLLLQLDTAPDPANNPSLVPSTGGIWDNVNITFYVQDPSGTTVAGLDGTHTELLSVSGGTLSTTGSLTIADGGTAIMSIIVDTDGSALVGDSGTLRWIAIADHS